MGQGDGYLVSPLAFNFDDSSSKPAEVQIFNSIQLFEKNTILVNLKKLCDRPFLKNTLG